MKKKKLLIAAVSVFLICSINANSEPYHYPVLPGDSLWKATINYADRVKLCNIPNDVLMKMTTEDLLITIFQFPYIQNLVLMDNFLWAIESQRSLFNGLNSFIERSKAAPMLYERYNSSDNTMAQDMLLENLMSLPEILDKLDAEQKNTLLDNCLIKLSNRIEKQTFLKNKSLITASFLMIRLLLHLDYSRWNSIITRDEDIRKFCETSDYPSSQTCTNIIYEILKYKNERGNGR